MNSDDLRDVWNMFQREYGVTVDRMVCSPQLRQEFLREVRRTLGEYTEEQILWTAMNLRKQKKLKPAVPMQEEIEQHD